MITQPAALQDTNLIGAFMPSLSNASVLIVDDEPGMRNFLVKTLLPHCAHVEEASDAIEASSKLDKKRYDIIILDNIMPGQSGIDWLSEQREVGLFADAILITAYAELETVIAAIRVGAVDFLLKPFRANQILNAVARCLDRANLQRENNLLRHELDTSSNLLRHRNRLIGSSDEIEEVREMLTRFARLPSNVIITGESGTGKEVAARMLHDLSERANRPFVSMTCAARSRETFEEDLFGRAAKHLDGVDQKEGLLLSAQGGTLFLDDVDELPPQAQIALIKVIEANSVLPISAAREIPLDVRLVFSSTKPLLPMVQAGEFRDDLFYRINVLNVHIPPLRERPTDILDLTRLFLEQMQQEFNVDAPEMTASVRTKLLSYDWPGNVRELRNHIERALIQGDLSIGLDSPHTQEKTDTLAAIERRHILDTLEACGGNRAEAARRLDVSRKTIDRKCRAWGL
ncbi:MAG: sigma-54-dependent Fis family transcriptional regulator [Hyphomicrobiales bacterium]|nr:MAG: sigma-54-dependent Fis family transcriptional regulator [Hyphomicrobiales bacterium]